MNAYTPLLILGGITAAFAVVSVAIAVLIGLRRYNLGKFEAYECGVEPQGQRIGPTQRFPIRYYLTAMLFIVNRLRFCAHFLCWEGSRDAEQVR